MADEPIKSIQGTQDLLPGQWAYWDELSDVARRTCEAYGYGPIRTPIFEDTRLFVKGTGETTEIVEKQMYTIDTGSDSLTLRPEGTPPVVRSYLEHNLHKQEPFRKLYYVGAMFRHERPQKGRLREFFQVGAEAVGSDSPMVDAETIMLAVDILRGVGLSGFRVCLNSMGCAECRPGMRENLHALLAERSSELCDDHRDRLDRNVFRVLDCKKPGCRAVSAELPPVTDWLCGACADHYATVKRLLDACATEFEEDPHLVRGLDYYTRTVYELKHGGIGARDALGGGGRYDGLVELLGGPPTPCAGFAMGFESTILAMEAERGEAPEERPAVTAFVVAFGDEARDACFGLVEELRRAGVSADMDFEGRSPKSQMRVANRSGAAVCLLIGSDELESGEVTVRDMADSSQQRIARGDVVSAVRRAVGT
jgi:histidyl-tRNA synthetase